MNWTPLRLSISKYQLEYDYNITYLAFCAVVARDSLRFLKIPQDSMTEIQDNWIRSESIRETSFFSLLFLCSIVVLASGWGGVAEECALNRAGALKLPLN